MHCHATAIGRISRSLSAFALICCVAAQSAIGNSTFEERRQTALDGVAAMPLTGDGNHKAKSGVYIAMARYARGDIAGGNQMAEWVINNPAGSAMFLCMAGMDLYKRYGHHMTQSVRDKYKRFVTGFAPYQGGSSENHYTMFNVGGYLASEEWNDASNLEVTRTYMLKKLDWICRYGIKEHDSPIYHTCHVNSVLSLYDHADDSEVRQAALLALEVMLADWAHEWQRGAWCASTLRGTSVLDHNGLAGGTGWLYFGGDHTPSWGDGYAAMSCASEYRMPAIIYRIATDRSTPYLYRSSDDQIPVQEGNTRFDGTRVNYPAGFRKTTWMGKGYGIYGQYDGNGRLGWNDQMRRAGINWVGGSLMLTPRNSPGYQMLIYDGCMAGSGTMGHTTSGVQPQGSADGWQFMTGGDRVYIAFKQSGTAFGYVTADKDDYADVAAFKTAVREKASLSVSGANTVIRTLNGHTLEIAYDGREFSAFDGIDTDRQTIDGERVVYDEWPRMGSPFASGAVGGDVLTLSYGDSTRTYDFAAMTITDASQQVSATAGNQVVNRRTGRGSQAEVRMFDLCGRVSRGRSSRTAAVMVSRTATQRCELLCPGLHPGGL